MNSSSESYLSEHSVSSWLLTTDHKRIGILYLLSIIVYFAIAAAAAALMRIELLQPNGTLVLPETCGRLASAWRPPLISTIAATMNPSTAAAST